MTTDRYADAVANCVSEFHRRRVLVLGDAILDEYLIGDSNRISPEAPVPVLRVNTTRRALGGAANTAANIVSLGGRAVLIALVGDDEGGHTLKDCAKQAGVEFHAIGHGRATLRKTRVVAQQQQIVRLDYEDVQRTQPSVESEILATFRRSLTVCDLVVISDYAKGFVSAPLCQSIIRLAHEAGRPVVIDPRPENRACYVGCDYLTPNWRESRALLGLPDAEPSPEAAVNVARSVAAALDTNVVLTLGSHGIGFCSRNGAEQFALPTLAREVFDVSGAGDTVAAAFALARAAGADHATAVALANRAASVVVGKFGTATVTADELLAKTEARLVPRQDLRRLAATLRAKGKRIVTLNGNFDILHGGHLHILNEARSLGDVLIVGVNSDSSVRASKGPTRPINQERHRADMLLALRIVDYVHIFDESNPIAFLSEVNPDLHVNGSEYGEDCIESETVRRGGGRIHLVNRIPGLSTSNIAASLVPSSKDILK